MNPIRQRKHDRLMTSGASSAEIACDHAVAPFDRACEVDGCDKPQYLRGFCNAHYIRLRRHGSPTAGGTSKRAPIAWLRAVIADPPDACVQWPFASNGNGYGWARYDGKRIGAHRLSLVLATGETNPHLVAAHQCHNRGCVNPKHLSWVTQQENLLQTRDCGKGRSKLNPGQVREIKASDLPHAKLAQTFGVSVSTIQKIRSGAVWHGL